MKNKITPLYGFLLLLVVLILTHLYHEEVGYDQTISWEVTSEANKETFTPISFEKGAFNFEITGFYYVLTERFSATPIRHSQSWQMVYLVIIWIGLAGILAISSFWKRYSFLAVCAVFILFFNYFQLDALNLFGTGANSKWITIIGLILTVGPAYIFHAFLPDIRLLPRWGVIAVLTIAFFIVLQANHEHLYTYWMANSTFGLAVFTLLFIFLISEEIVFLILYFITKNKGGRHNEKHFLIFGGVYITYLALYYLKKAGILDTDVSLVNPFYLLVISSLISIWSLKKKQTLYDSVNTEFIDIRWIFIVLGLVCFGFLNMGMVRGNDPVYESMHYLIIYTHLGFGFMFLAYIILNFLSPLVQGLQVQKIAYKERNFPYSTARLGGLAAIAAFFFLSNREPLELIIGAKNNYLADYYEKNEERVVSSQYYKQGAAYAWDNHYSNYRLGSFASKDQDINEAYYRFFRATRRYPSPYAYVNASNRLLEMEKSTEVIPLLREGQVDFPKNNEIKNNLALALKKNGAYNEAAELLEQSGHSSWNMANMVNKWSIRLNKETLAEEYQSGNTAVKSNIFSQLIVSDTTADIPLDTEPLKGAVDLHKIAYLINANWVFPGFDTLDITRQFLDNMQLAETRKDLLQSYALSHYKAGNVSEALRKFDDLQNSSNSIRKAYYLNQLGLLALDQHSPLLALDFFNRSAIYKNADGQFNRLVALLEAGKWKKDARLIASEQEVFENVLPGITEVKKKKKSNTPGYVYYRWKEFEKEELASIVSQFSQDQVLKIWKKIKNHYFSTYELELLNEYYMSFAPFLPTRETQKYQDTMNEELKVSASEAEKNFFHEEYILQWVNQENVSEEEKYNLLVNAVEYNPYSIGLLKAYSLAAVDMGLSDYAEFSLVSLYELLPEEEYNTFVNEFDQYIRSRQDQDWNF